MKKTLLFIFIFLLIGCKKANLQTVNNINLSQINKAQSFIGTWEWKSDSEINQVLENLFSLHLKQIKGDSIIGQYCAIYQGGNKIDCSNDDENNVKGIIKNNKLFIEFYSFFSIKKEKGKAEIELVNNTLKWKIIHSPKAGEFYTPDNCILTKYKGVEKKNDNQEFSIFYESLPSLALPINSQKLIKKANIDKKFLHYDYDKSYFEMIDYNVIGKFKIKDIYYIIYNFSLIGKGEGFQDNIFLVNAYSKYGIYLDNLVIDGSIGGEGGSNIYASKIDSDNFFIYINEEHYGVSTGLDYTVSIKKTEEYNFNKNFNLLEEKYSCMDINTFYYMVKTAYNNKKYDIILNDYSFKIKPLLSCYPIVYENVEKYNDIGYYLEQSKVYSESIYLLQMIVQKYPHRVVAWLNLADAQWEDENQKEAKESYEEYLKLMKIQKKDLSRIPQRVYTRTK